MPVRERPALFNSPYWRDKDLRAYTELWRDRRKKYTTCQIGVWGEEGSEIIGLMHGGVPTHYAFYLKDILDNPKALDGIYFDAGTSYTELYVEPEEWRRVLRELDVMSRYHSLQSQAEQSTTTEDPGDEESVL